MAAFDEMLLSRLQVAEASGDLKTAAVLRELASTRRAELKERGGVERIRAQTEGKLSLARQADEIAVRNRAIEDAIRVRDARREQQQINAQKRVALNLAVTSPGSEQLQTLINSISDKGDVAGAAHIRNVAEQNRAVKVARAQDFVVRNVAPGVDIGQFTTEIQDVAKGERVGLKILENKVKEANVRAMAEAGEIRRLAGTGLPLTEAQRVAAIPATTRPIAEAEAVRGLRRGQFVKGAAGAGVLGLVAHLLFGREKTPQNPQIDPRMQAALMQQLQSAESVGFDRDTRTMARILGMIKTLENMSGVQSQTAPPMAGII